MLNKKTHVIDTNKGSEALESLLGFSQENFQKIVKSLEKRKNLSKVRNFVSELHPADMADLYQQLSVPLREVLLEILGDNLDGKIIAHLEDSLRDDVLGKISSRPLARLLEGLESDDAIDILESLQEKKQRAVLGYVSLADRNSYSKVLSYDQDTAARIMRTELVSVPDLWTVGHVIDMLHKEQKSLPEKFLSIIVLDRNHRPLGTVSLSALLTSSRTVAVTKLRQQENFYAIPANMDQEDVACLFQQYDLIEAPVVDDKGRLLGIITVDDIVDVIEEETEDDILKLGGVREGGDFYRNPVRTASLRFPWLLANLFAAILVASIINMYTITLEKFVTLAVLMPMVASMGGNAGTQTLTVTVRALATKDLTSANILRIIWKEILVGSINGLLFASIVDIGVSLWFKDIELGAIVGCGLIVNLLVAGIAGTVIPLILNKMKIDPAISSNVFLTTITDTTGFFIFLMLASWLLT